MSDWPKNATRRLDSRQSAPQRSGVAYLRAGLREGRSRLLLILFLGVMTTLCAAGLMLTSGYLISKAATLPENILLIYTPIVLTRAFGIGRPAVHYAERLSSHDWVLRKTSVLRARLFTILEKQALFLRDRHQLGGLLGLLSEDIGHLQNLFLRTLVPFFCAWGLMLLLTIALLGFSPLIALVFFLALLLLSCLLPLAQLLGEQGTIERVRLSARRLYERVGDLVFGLADWKIGGTIERYIAAYAATEREKNDLEAALNRRTRRRTFAAQLIFLLFLIVTLIWAQMFFGRGDRSWIAAAVLALFPLSDAYIPLIREAGRVPAARVSIDRLGKLEAEGAAEENKTPPVDGAAPALSGAAASPDLAGLDFQTLTLRALSFHWPESGPENDGYSGAVENINLNLRKGEKLALLGRSGSGKTTLLRLIRGDLQPNGGEVLINGRPLRGYRSDPSELFAVLEQDAYLFHTTLFNNLRLAREDLTREEASAMLERLGLGPLLRRLPKGIDSVSDEAGHVFSGGERQRLMLARALLTKAPVLLVDEAANGLDPRSESELLAYIFELCRDKTLIWATHHLLGVERMDHVLFLREGEGALQGSPAELADSSAYFRRLLELDRGWASSDGALLSHACSPAAAESRRD